MPRLVPLIATAAACLAAAGCGSGGGDDMPPATPEPSGRVEDFPAAKGKTLADLRGTGPEGPVVAPAMSVLAPGRNRVAFALFDRARKQLSGARVAIYVAKADGSGARGPFVARSESLAVKPQFRSRQAASDPDAARGVYVTDIDLPRRGKYLFTALARLDGRLLSTNQLTMEVGGTLGRGIPAVGEPARIVHTPTRADVGGNLDLIDTRIPPLPSLHRVDFADVVGKRPVVLLFATPQLCQSRVCGPVVDIAAQVQARVKGSADFVHMEIYRDNTMERGFRPQVAAYRLPSEPWAFVVDAKGRIVARFEGAFSAGELERAVVKATRND
jgi:hypothetical protein